MTRLLILAEGDTEELFVREILAPHLAKFEVYATATGVVSKRLASGKKITGGNLWGNVRNSLKPLLQDSDAWVTTLLDYYGLPDDFPGVSAGDNTVAHLNTMEQALSEAVNHPPRFIPFLVLHEFEAWYFASPNQVAAYYGQPNIARLMQEASDGVGGPEAINHGKETHPSKRLEGYGVGFRKTTAVALLKEIGIPVIRAACPHFAAWLDRLEALAQEV
ncbi:MAG: hypothetical protein A2286_09290 [Gammaproteobacteria bacterium RIFOXYA12_FULL_61_12]|nr:MAG: hypothetical protein A2286_09290 [Gammaproteobacteria bacterium RIFOXYA12_FULL_61_12]OGT88225.1 MAG: hypothetical protein A2514_01160 [Gammaproteobacteria bacterium RIFOXYD12_FULL_61_37]